MFTILHQSTSPMMIAPETDVRAVEPLYCIASGHNLQYKYMWDNITEVVGVKSPICFAFEPGTYRCTVTTENGEEAYSQSIVVREGTCLLSSVCVCAFH